MGGDETDRRLAELFIRLARQVRPSPQSLAPLGLTPAQALALSVIGHCDQALRMTELATRLHVVPRAVTPLVDALEEAGLVRRRTDPDNRRSTLLEMTSRGSTLYSQIQAIRQRATAELFAPLSAAQRRSLLELLETVDEHRPASSAVSAPG